MILFLPVFLLAQGTQDYYPLKPGMSWEFVGADGKTEIKSVGETKKIGDYEYRLIRNALVGTPPEREIPALVSAQGVALFDEHDQRDVCWLKLPARPGTEWSHKSSVGLLRMKQAPEEEIEVPAGKYKALKVVTELEIRGAKGTMTTWYAKGIGEVRSDLVLKVNDEDRSWSRCLRKVLRSKD
jgi:hypothetical protein